MKKIMIFAAMAAMFSLASCQKDEVVANNDAKVSPVFTASINAGTTKTTVNVSNGKIAWEDTDEITITDNSGTSAVYDIKSNDQTTGKATFKLKSGEPELGDGPYTATYGSAPSTYQTYSATAGKLYMTAASNDKDFVFTVQCCLMKLYLSKSGETITNIAVTGTPTGGTAKMTYTMYCPGGVDISSGKDFFIALPAGSYEKIEVYKHDSTNGFMVCSLIPSTSIAVSANHIKPVNASDGKIIFSKCQNLPGVFSVSDNNGTTINQVRFSQGNLVATIDATGAPKAWKFATNQYDYIGGNVANTSIGSTAGDVDLFGWSTNASSNNWGIHTKTTSENNYTTGSFNDWGTAYCEKNSIDVGTWRTLSTAEWQYLFNTRTMTNGKDRYSNAVSGVTIGGATYKGVFLYPDNYNGEVVSSSMTWDAINAAGIVFLPATGYRGGSDVKYVGTGFYWSSTVGNFDVNASAVYFTSGSVTHPNNINRSNGISVRLITESK